MTSITPGHNEPPVIVVGAGPVGMTATAMLAREGIPVVLIEAEAVPKTDWRASTFHAATLELLERIDITGQMVAEGLAVPRYQFRDRRDGLVAEFDLTLLKDETPYPYRLQLNQQHLVRMLHERLRTDDNVTMFFGSRVREVVSTGDGATVLMETGNGPVTLHGSYVIGADGASSTVRQSLGVDFAGYTHPERFLIASTTADISELVPGIADVNYVADPREWLFILRTPESWRAVWPVPPEVSREEATSPQTLQAQLQGLAAFPGGYPIVDHQIYNVHQRVASTFRVGNTMIIGDAAHINSPMGGVGLNSGIHDAIDVTTRIARVLAGTAEREDELRTFAEIRRRVAVEYVQADTRRNTERLAETDDARRRENQDEMRAIAGDPDRARAWMRRVSLLESVQRFGIGTPPHEYESIRAAAG
ncbi:FAD-dependent oxidoreductase [Actinomadura sp. HBU206391]|uniref:FAD-dependent oxidoreductase n=1 Tax=Actinomadura sp. HBU206391 TaxID=2731692 RepID=UPI0016507983|nr:FAD-dependent monooxygenase [Actinomadura sp. HBU206391]MBC6457202.1 FAD-dependent monooxygenase [Actinomadura sp. HBU206391]